MNLRDIKRDAVTKNDIEVQWDVLEQDPNYETEFVKVCELVREGIPGLEFIYNKLTSGKSVSVEGQDTPLRYDEIETYTDACADELYAAYQIVDVYERYMSVKNLIKT